MTTGCYSLIRCVPDPARGELFNIGLIAWHDGEFRIVIHEDAAKRAINQSPFLARDAWAYYERYLQERFVRSGTLDVAAVQRFATEPISETLRLSKPAMVRIDESSRNIDAKVGDLIKHLVRPHVTAHRSGTSPVEELRSKLRSQIKLKSVYVNHCFEETRTGRQRSVDFFLNHGRNLALDGLRLDLARSDDILQRVDAEAFKIEDIRERNQIEYVVYCKFSLDKHHERVNDDSKRVLSSVGAHIVTNLDEALVPFVDAPRPMLQAVDN